MSVGQNLDDQDSKEAIGYMVTALKSVRKMMAFLNDNSGVIFAVTLMLLGFGLLSRDNRVLVTKYNDMVKKHNKVLAATEDFEDELATKTRDLQKTEEELKYTYSSLKFVKEELKDRDWKLFTVPHQQS